jgi:hypothetical protein
MQAALWLLQVWLLGLVHVTEPISPASGDSRISPILPNSASTHACFCDPHMTTVQTCVRQPGARHRKHLRLRGGSLDAATGDNHVLPERVRSLLMETAEVTYEHETALELSEGMPHMTIQQRLIWERSFAYSRQQGVRVPEAQALAIRSAAEGRVIEPDSSMTGPKNIMCLACHYEIYDRSLLKSHFSSDWHALNLERRRLGVAPLPQHHFQQRAEELLKNEMQREEQAMQEESLSETRRMLKKASSRSAKLSADIAKLLSANERDEASLAKVRMLLDKKATCDREVQELAAKLAGTPTLNQIAYASSAVHTTPTLNYNMPSAGRGAGDRGAVHSRGRGMPLGVTRVDDGGGGRGREITETAKRRAAKEAMRYTVQSDKDVKPEVLRDGGDLMPARIRADTFSLHLH